MKIMSVYRKDLKQGICIFFFIILTFLVFVKKLDVNIK